MKIIFEFIHFSLKTNEIQWCTTDLIKRIIHNVKSVTDLMSNIELNKYSSNMTQQNDEKTMIFETRSLT